MTSAVFTDNYLKFTDLYFRSVVEEEEEAPQIPEKVIRCVWNDQLLKTDELQTTLGKRLEVVFAGHWNFGAGPDFKDAVIRIDGKTLEGDIELHVYGTDWKVHGHSDNNDYDDVILHVFMWQNRSGKPSANGHNRSRPHIDEIELKHFLKEGLLKLKDRLDFDSYPLLNQFNTGLCYGPLSRLNTPKFEELLNQAGDARIQTKMDRFHDRIILNGYEQTFYEGIAEALGYPANKAPFRKLAQRVTLADLHPFIPEKGTDAERALPLQAALMGVSGLLEHKCPKTTELEGESRLYIESLRRYWKQLEGTLGDRTMDPDEWKFGRMRPANFPYRRLSALSHLVVQHQSRGIFQEFISLLNTVVSISRAKGYNARTGNKAFHFFYLEKDDYWARHYTPGGKKLQGNQKLIGPDRAREMFINIAIPIGLIYARASRMEELETFLHQNFSSRSSLGDNQWLRFMKRYLLGSEERMLKVLRSDRQTQGLMQVYQDFCTKNKNNCLRCRFPGVVDHYFS